MESLISTFHIDWKIIIAQLINFGVVILVVYVFALKPLKKLMSERSSKIARGIHDAEANAEILKATTTEYDKALREARAKALVIFNEGKKEAEEKRNELLSQTATEVEEMIANGKKALETEKEKMLLDAKKEVANLVIQATQKILETEDTSNIEEKVAGVIKTI